MSLNNPGNVWENVWEMSGTCRGHAGDMSGNVEEMSGKCRGNVGEMSEKCRGNVGGMSWECRGMSGECWGMFGTFRMFGIFEIVWICLGLLGLF